MDKEFLVTYSCNVGIDFRWFETEEEVQKFILKGHYLRIFDAIKINDCEEIEY